MCWTHTESMVQCVYAAHEFVSFITRKRAVRRLFFIR